MKDKVASPSSPSEIERLQEYQTTTTKLRIPPDIKPCIANLLNGSSPEAREGINPFIIACELERIGQSDEQIGAKLIDIGITRSQVRGAVKSATIGKYQYGCPRLEEIGLCLEKTRFDCWWFGKIARQSQKSYRNRDFWRYHWPQMLGLAASMIYLAIIEIEKKRRIWAGSWLFISRRELSRVSGASQQTAIDCCEKLKKVGLIEFRKGTQHKHYQKASQVKRIIPIPQKKSGVSYYEASE